MKDTMYQGYYNSMKEMLELRFPDKDPNELSKILKNIMKVRINESNNSNNYKILYDRNGVVLTENERENNRITLFNLENYIDSTKPIMNGFGTLFKRHDQFDNILAEMIRTLKAKRKEYKNEMFKHINDEDPSIKEMYDSRQKTTKILNNSFYGATSESNSIFYHPYFGMSVTFAGEDLVTIAAKAFENFLGNNIVFENITDVLIYIKNIAYEEYTATDKVKLKKNISKDKLLSYLKEHTIDTTNFDSIKDVLNSLETNFESEEIFQNIYYKNNFMEFLNDSDILDNYFSKIIDRYDFNDPNSPPEDMKDILNDIWSILNDYIFYNYQDFYRFKRIDVGTRKVVLTIKFIGCH